MARKKYAQRIDTECSQCGQKFTVCLDTKASSVSYCPICGEEIVAPEDECLDEYEDSEEEDSWE